MNIAITSVPRNPSATKTGPGRRHVSGHKKSSFKIQRNGKLGSGWMHQRLLRWIAEKHLQKIEDRKVRAKIQRNEGRADAVAAEFKRAAENTVTVMQDFNRVVTEASETAGSVLAVDEAVILNLITTLPGSSSHLINALLQEQDIFLSDTQVERRLKKLREAGKIRYDKSAKGWFVVTE